MQKSPYVYIVDDDAAIRDSLEMLLKSVDIPTVCYASAEEFLQNYDPNLAGCLVLDIRMSGMDGMELQRLLKEAQAPLSIIIMTGHGDVSMAVQAIKNGATEFIEKPFDNNMLIKRIRENWEKCDEIQFEHDQHETHAKLFANLTKREKEVMQLLVNGKQNKTVASALGISTRTAELHRARVMEKLQAKSLSDVVRIALAVD